MAKKHVKMFQQMGQNVLELSVQHGPEMAHILTLLEERVKKTTCSECGKTGTTTMCDALDAGPGTTVQNSVRSDTG